MMTIKEMSKLTGVSARALRYYDEIGLLTPTGKSEAGYRLYDEEALSVLQQILYFRELDIPLKTIKEIIENPALDRNHVLRLQKSMLKNMPEELRETAVKEFGSVEAWKEHYLDAVSSEKVQKQYAKVVEWYGGKEAYKEAVEHPLSEEIRTSYKNRIDHILERISEKRDLDVDSFEIRSLVGEYGFVMKQLLQLKDEKEIMLSQAGLYLDEQVKGTTDAQYGPGFAEFLHQAIEAFYKR